MSTKDVLVVGGGISGLAAAWWLARRGVSVEVWEGGDRPGGKIASTRDSGYLLERSASLVMNYLPQVDRLMTEAGLDEARSPRSRTANRYLVHEGALQPVPAGAGAMFRSALWSTRGKLRMLAEPFVPRGGRPDETVSEFVSRRLGREILERGMEPYVAGPLASDPDLACARSVLPRLTALERRYGSITAGVVLSRLLRRRRACRPEAFSFRGGMQTLVQALAAEPGVDLRTGRRAVAVTPETGGWHVDGEGPGGALKARARHVVLSVPAPAAASLLRPLDTEAGTLLDGVRSAPVLVVHTGFARGDVGHALDGAGFLVPRAEGALPSGCLWMSSLFPDRAPDGHVLLTSYLGGARMPEVADWDDERAAALVVERLEGLLGLRGAPGFVRVERHPRALPLYHGAYAARMTALDAHIGCWKGLHLAASFKDGVSVRDRIAVGEQVARDVTREMAGAAPPVAVRTPVRVAAGAGG